MGRFVVILGLCIFLVGLGDVSSGKIDPTTAVGVWLLDEGGGDTAIDSSGLGNDGVIQGAKWVEGKIGKALEFDGAHWVAIPSTPELQFTGELTMMAWFFATDIGDWRQIIAKSDEYLLRIDPPGEGNNMSAFVKPGGNWEPRASAGVPDLDTWIHFVATYNGEQLIVYVNGLQTGASSRPGKISATVNDVELGRWGGGSYFVGIIDEAAIFNVALEAEDIQLIIEHGLNDALGGLSVSPGGKLATMWSQLRIQNH